MALCNRAPKTSSYIRQSRPRLTLSRSQVYNRLIGLSSHVRKHTLWFPPAQLHALVRTHFEDHEFGWCYAKPDTLTRGPSKRDVDEPIHRRTVQLALRELELKHALIFPFKLTEVGPGVPAGVVCYLVFLRPVPPALWERLEQLQPDVLLRSLHRWGRVVRDPFKYLLRKMRRGERQPRLNSEPLLAPGLDEAAYLSFKRTTEQETERIWTEDWDECGYEHFTLIEEHEAPSNVVPMRPGAPAAAQSPPLSAPSTAAMPAAVAAPAPPAAVPPSGPIPDDKTIAPGVILDRPGGDLVPPLTSTVLDQGSLITSPLSKTSQPDHPVPDESPGNPPLDDESPPVREGLNGGGCGSAPGGGEAAAPEGGSAAPEPLDPLLDAAVKLLWRELWLTRKGQPCADVQAKRQEYQARQPWARPSSTDDEPLIALVQQRLQALNQARNRHRFGAKIVSNCMGGDIRWQAEALRQVLAAVDEVRVHDAELRKCGKKVRYWDGALLDALHCGWSPPPVEKEGRHPRRGGCPPRTESSTDEKSTPRAASTAVRPSVTPGWASTLPMWQEVCGELRLAPADLELWLMPCGAVAEGSRLTVTAPTAYHLAEITARFRLGLAAALERRGLELAVEVTP